MKSSSFARQIQAELERQLFFRNLRSPVQLKVVDDESKFKALLCGRRAGKTIEDIFCLTEALMCYPGDSCAFIELTRPSARKKLWSPWKLLNDQYGFGLEFKTGALEVWHPNGAVCHLAGTNRDEELDKVRGLPRLRLAIVDECGMQKPSHLQYLTEEVLEPGLADVGGALQLSGTPGLVPIGYWYDVTTGERPGWSIHHWDMYQNPFIDAMAFVEGPTGLLARRGWTTDHPVYQREYLGLWTVDAKRRVYPFDPARNVVDDWPVGRDWTFVLSHDYGTVASTAWVILGYPKYGDLVVVFEAFKYAGLAPSEAADISKYLIDKWRPGRVIGDLGGLGKGYAAELVKRHNIAVQPADKTVKRATIEFQADAMRLGKILSLRANKELHAEWHTLQWDERREDFAEGQDDHISEAVLYGWRACPAYANMLIEPSRERDSLPGWVDRDDDYLVPDEPTYKPYWQSDDF